MKINQSVRKKIRDIVIREVKKEEIGKATLTTPYELTTEDLGLFYNVFPFLQTKQLEKICDKKLIAGFILKWDSKILDLSLVGRIDRLLRQNIAN